MERRRIRATARIAVQFRDAALDRRALGREPRVAIVLSTVVEGFHQRAPLVEAVVAVTADPAVAEPVAKDFEVRPVHAAGVDRLSRLCAQRIDHERDLVVQRAGAPLRGAQQLGQERVRLRRVEAYQGQKRPRERRVIREHVPSACTDLVRGKAGVD